MFRKDLELVPGAGFRLRRRGSARLLSGLLALAALGWGAYDLAAGLRVVGGATLVLALAFTIQLVQAELHAWRFEGDSLRSHRFRIESSRIEGVRLGGFEEGRARAWVETRDGEELALVEGEEDEVRRIADRLSRALLLASPHGSRQMLN